MTALPSDLPSRTSPNSAQWLRSSYSTGANNCVETARLSGRLAVRDSKDPDGPSLFFSPESWAGFTAAFH
ncbi:DUF397 domain-containing protein [Streptomyces sp. NPDC005017]|uniref:DUF397 domain-containing protein n=1 Tax=Streptomyces sp. NPDC005017 TaxID=3364706 RepID=UPI003680D9D0